MKKLDEIIFSEPFGFNILWLNYIKHGMHQISNKWAIAKEKKVFILVILTPAMKDIQVAREDALLWHNFHAHMKSVQESK